MLGKITIRNIPALIWQGLETLAARNIRSVEGEARMALQAWVEPQIQSDERSARRIDVSTRLRALLDAARGGMPGKVLKISHIAQGISSPHSEPVEKWFTGEIEPSFDELERVASYLGGQPGWLQHGDNTMFKVTYLRLPENASEAVQSLLEIGPVKSGPMGALTHLHLIRENHETGRFVLVKQYGEYQCKTFSTPLHLSEETGSGGRTALMHFSVTLELLDALYKKKPQLAGVEGIKGYVLPEHEFESLVNGQVHPLSLLQFSRNDSPWWEDLWDSMMFPKREYWPGWVALCAGLYGQVRDNKSLRAEVESIRNQTHPLLQEH